VGEVVPPLVAQMGQAYNDGELKLTERLALEILEAEPGHKEALGALYNVCKDAGRLRTANVLIRRLVALHPNDPTARLILARFLLSVGAAEDAVTHARRLVQLSPEEVLAHMLAAQAFTAVAQLVAAEHHYRRALALAPAPQLEILGGLADVLRRLGRVEEARACFVQADALGASFLLRMSWAALEEADRRFEAAAAILDRAAEIHPRDPRLAIARATLHMRAKAYESALDELDQLREQRKDDLGALALLEHGRALDATGRYDEAFAAFDQAKRKVREIGGGYQAERAQALVGELKDFFTPGRTSLLPRASTRSDAPQPIFIVGFPRSGTTLVEQVLSAHAQISGGDELPIVNATARRLPALLASPLAYPTALSELWLGDRIGEIENLRDHYLNEARRQGAIAPGARWFTDKMPLNETHLGLIHLMFPQAAIIHVIRHPLDVMVSVYSNALTHGFNCASGLDTAATHYALIADLVAHYRDVLPLNYLQVRYEDLVEDLPGQAAALLDFIGAPFDPQVVPFHQNRRLARTASYAQVTERLYARSRYRHRHYQRHLAPAAAQLEKLIRELGYAQPQPAGSAPG
jgi:tetratricopeptide (TPR) repeat protein